MRCCWVLAAWIPFISLKCTNPSKTDQWKTDFNLRFCPRTPAAARPPHGHEPGWDRGHAPGHRVVRALGGGRRPGPDEARAETEVWRESQCGGEQRRPAGQCRRSLVHPGREEGAGPRPPHHCPGFILCAGTCSRFFKHAEIELLKDPTLGCTIKEGPMYSYICTNALAYPWCQIALTYGSTKHGSLYPTVLRKGFTDFRF